MRVVRAEFETVTPIFMGGGDSTKVVDRLRPPSVKGALRFWWRAIRWGPALAGAGGDVAAALRALHQEEAELFGHANAGDSGQQSRVLLRIVDHELKADRQLAGSTKPGIKYLLGQDLTSRPHGLAGTFTLECLFRPDTSDESVGQVKKALWLFGLLGGLGARTRRGIGSIAIRRLDGSTGPLTRLAYGQFIREHLRALPTSEPPFSALSQSLRVEISQTGRDRARLVDSVGQTFQQYRKENFKDDTRQALRVVRGEDPQRIPRRAAFGLPHNYYFPKTKSSVTIEPASEGRQRRASPLFLHIHHLRGESNGFLAVYTHLPAVFLPKGDQVAMGNGRKVRLDPEHDPTVIPDYLDHFDSRETLFPEARRS